jgi:hypothetical protein
MGRFFTVLLSINGIEFPAPPDLVGHIAERSFSGDVSLEITGADWLLGTDVFVLQKQDAIGENCSTLMVFPQMDNRVVEFSVTDIS